MNYFDDPESKHFSFESFAEGLDDTTFAVINFTGKETISSIYDFEIMLMSDNRDIDLETVLQAQAVFTIHRGGDDDVLYNGILAEFEQLHEANNVIFYRARLVPKVWWLTLTHHNQVFLDQSVPEIIEGAFRDGGMESEDFDVSGLSGYEALDYSCQYDESHFNYVSRLMERQGIYYYFLQEDDGEVMVLTDTKFSHEGLKEGADLFYNPASGLEGHHLGEAIGSFNCRQKQLPAEIILKDFNYEKPSLDITSRAEVDEMGRGVSYLYGEYFATQEEGERFAGIRAEELLCQKQVFHGTSTVPYMMPGFTFNLNNHYRDDFNQEYLVTEVQHEGNQSHMISAGIAPANERAQNMAIYSNSFTAIPAETQYRPERLTIKPKISGTIHAKIDSEIDSKYAQMDAQGRYRVKLPFDINEEHMDGKGSAPVRMMQPYAGTDRGMQFPLVKGTEVLLTFIEGNPDRPVIAGAVSNPENTGPVNASNQSESVIQSGGSNRIRMEDKMGSQRLVMETPYSNSWIRMGAHNDPVTMNGRGTVRLAVGDTEWQDPGAFKIGTDSSGKIATSAIVARIEDAQGNPIAVDDFDTSAPGTYYFIYESLDTSDPRVPSKDGRVIRTVIVGEEAASTPAPAATPAPDGSIPVADDGTSDTVLYKVEDADGIRLHTAGSLYYDALGKYATFVGDIPPADTLSEQPDTPPTDQNYLRELRSKFGVQYNPKNLLAHFKNSDDSRDDFTYLANAFDDGLDGVELKVSSLDTFTTQEGNIYDFGGYWNYNLGNSYEENFIKQAFDTNDPADDTDSVNPELNLTRDVDLLDVGGPHWGSITWPSNNQSDSISTSNVFSNVGQSDTQLEINYDNDGDVPSKQLWVTKSFGDAYEYTEGKSISVTKGSSLEVQHGGRHVEVKYSGSTGKMTYWSKSESAQSWEKKFTKNGQLFYDGHTDASSGNSVVVNERTFDRTNGGVATYHNSHSTGMRYSSFDFDFTNKATASISSGTAASTDTFVGIKTVNENYVGGLIKIENHAGLKLVNENLAGMSIKIELSAAGIVEIKNTRLKAEFPGISSDVASTKLETKMSYLKAVGTVLTTRASKLQNALTDCEGIIAVKITG